MTHRKLIAGVAALGLIGAGGGVAVAARSAPKSVNVKAVQKNKVKVNRYFQDGLRWNKDVYTVKSGGTVRVTQLAPNDGPHSFSIVKKKDLPKTAKQMNNCAVCNKIGQEHAFDQNTGAPQFLYTENGTGQNTAPNLDQPGDSAFIGPNKGDHVSLHVTAKKGTKLYAICALHPWMQAVIDVK